MPYVNANGIKFFVQQAGAGEEVIVLIHGLVIDNLSGWWLTVVPRLARTFSVMCYDQRGHGMSDRPETGYGVDAGVADFFALRRVLRIDRPVHVVGNSYGGVLAVAAAMERPDAIASISLVDSFLPIAGEATPEQQLSYPIETARTFLQEGDDQAWKALSKDFDYDQEELDAWIATLPKRRLAKWAHKSKALVEKTSIASDLRRFPGFSADEVRAVSQPVLLMYGARSQNLTNGRRLAELLPQPTLRVFDEQDHFLLARRPDAVAATLTEWLAGVRC